MRARHTKPKSSSEKKEYEVVTIRFGVSPIAWINDDMPYPVTTSAGPLTAMPLAWDLSDQRLLFQQHMDTGEFVEQVLRAFKTLDAEAAATGSGRILTLTITPWLMGQPHRIRALGALLDRILERGEVWPATGADIVDAWRAHAS
jgi:hypothetical protein